MDNTIDILRLDKRLQYKLKKVGILSCTKLMEMDITELQKLGNFNNKDVELIKTVVADAILSTDFKTANESITIYKNRWKNILLDCSSLDEILHGGIPVRGITEISGESGVGKTQICLQLSITVQYPIPFGGLNASTIYICTEDKFPSMRLQQMLPYFPKNSQCRKKMQDHNFTDNILIDHIADLEGLNDCLLKRLPTFLDNSKMKVGLLIIDSIAALFRSEYAMNELISRANDMRIIGMHLHKLAHKYNIAIVCVNQVTDVCDNGLTVPALGLAWANLVTTKFHILFGTDKQFRTFKIISAPHLAPNSANYIITEKGVESLTT